MRNIAKRNYWFQLSIVIMIILISGCQANTSTGLTDPTAAVAYPALTMENQVQPDPASAYPLENGGNEYAQPISPEKVTVPGEAPQPEPDKASVSGVLYSLSSGKILLDFQIYLTPAQGDGENGVPAILVGPFSEKGDIVAFSDKKGTFQINNIPPGTYYIVLVAPGDYLLAVTSPTDNTPRKVVLQTNEAQPLGLIVFP